MEDSMTSTKGNGPLCPDCEVSIGEPHIDGCDVARCLQTGLQQLSCEATHDCGAEVWTGEWPGTAECREYGWMIGPDLPDVMRLFAEATWDAQAHRWVKLETTR
ncbi:hypothetical protein ACIA8G_21770 [Lentzea sp. NPDC051213]|uniref:hypothetical protein n=1 Tax=Lentzea sp. NPDC051213 TaxID=3364126 RepID=UPI003798971B